ncbi:MAG: putative metal-binding motif-containing protein [Myxococcota bacterium]
MGDEGRRAALGVLCTLALSLGGLAGCGDDAAALPDPDGGSPCRSDADCDDALFCTGEEACDPADAAADSRGCVPGPRPCPEGCDEARETCTEPCPDRDGDGAADLACGGTDCDDADRRRAPGLTEICDPDDVDEDCDPRTFGVRDLDGDGEPDAACCNGTNCGTDCDDTRASVSPLLPEVCDTLDNDCNGSVDEGVRQSLYPDEDGDGFGAMGATPSLGCFVVSGVATNDGDCDDGNAAINPAALELCTAARVDENCDGVIDPEALCTCTPGVDPPRSCNRPGRCAGGVEACVTTPGGGGAWGDCSVDPAPEVCNGEDDDCNELIDDAAGFACALGAAEDCTTATGLPGTRTCRSDCSGFDPCEAPEECNGGDDDADGETDEGFGCRLGLDVIPCTTACGFTGGMGLCGPDCATVPVAECLSSAEFCNYCDDNGTDGIDDEYVLATFNPDLTDFDVCRDHDLAGDAACPSPAGRARLAEVGAVSRLTGAGAVWLGDEIQVGYESFRVDATLELSSLSRGTRSGNMGWALVFAEAGDVSPLPAPSRGNDVGVPTDVDGFALEHDFFTGTSASDTFQLRDLDAAAADSLVGSCSVSGGAAFDVSESETVTVSLTYRPPNDARMIPRSLTASLSFSGGGSVSCSANATSGLDALSPGTLLRIGFTTKRRGIAGILASANVLLRMADTRVRPERRCFPASP